MSRAFDKFGIALVMVLLLERANKMSKFLRNGESNSWESNKFHGLRSGRSKIAVHRRTFRSVQYFLPWADTARSRSLNFSAWMDLMESIPSSPFSGEAFELFSLPWWTQSWILFHLVKETIPNYRLAIPIFIRQIWQNVSQMLNLFLDFLEFGALRQLSLLQVLQTSSSTSTLFGPIPIF